MTGKREKTAALSKGRQQGGLQKAALYFWKHKYLYLMLLPAILYYIIFCYVPMYGVTIAFKDFNPMLGIWKSPWAGTEMFQKLFGMEKFYSVFWNTIRISLIRLILSPLLQTRRCKLLTVATLRNESMFQRGNLPVQQEVRLVN